MAHGTPGAKSGRIPLDSLESPANPWGNGGCAHVAPMVSQITATGRYAAPMLSHGKPAGMGAERHRRGPPGQIALPRRAFNKE